MKPAPAANPKKVTMVVDRHALAEVVSDREVLESLLKIQFFIHGIRSVEQLLKRFHDLIAIAIPSSRGAILLFGNNPVEFELTTYRGDPYKVDLAMASHVARSREAMLNNDDPSYICVPLRVFDRNYGVVHLESAQAGAFTMHDFRLLIAAAIVAAVSLENTLYTERLEGENRRFREELNIQHGIVGESSGMREVSEFIARVAATDATALILGESGTGKELVANAIHRNGARASRPIIAVNSAAISSSLVESELFGAEKGAYTGALERKIGKFEAADKSTLFLDEIGEMPLPAQATLLRVLQEKEFHRVGGTQSIKVDVRVIAATNQNLAQLVKEKRFREDLYYRLRVVDIRMPSLAERLQDIPILTDYFIRKYRDIRLVNGITPEARAALADYDWPGNVRELQNAIVRVLVMGRSDFIQLKDLPKELTEIETPPSGAGDAIHSRDAGVRRIAIQAALERAGGNVTRAARKLGISRSYLHRQIRLLEI